MTPTPTANAGLPLRLGDFADLREALDYAAQGETGVNFYDARGTATVAMSYRTLRGHAVATAHRLRALGLVPGERVGIIADTSAAFLVLFYAAQYAGVVPCTLPYQTFPGARDAYIDQLQALSKAIAARWLLSPAGTLACASAAAGSAKALAFDVLVDLGAAPSPESPPPVDAGVPAYVQFSSGSTADPKGVVVRQPALMANATAIARHGLRMRADDRACSWLPLYHDMGLVGFSVVALCGQRSVDYLPPSVFAARPLAWLQLMSRQRTTIVYAPSFAWRLAAQRYRGESGVDLSALRIAGVGGDNIRASDLDVFADAFSSAGFRRHAFQPSYGLAEATLAVCMSDPDRLPRIDAVVCGADDDGTWLARPAGQERGIAQHFVGCGRPLPGTELRVLDGERRPLPERAIGRLWVRGPGVMGEYQCRDTLDALDTEGFLDTGDLGYQLDGEVFVTGRAKDLIMVRGRNLWPQDLERVAARAAPLGQDDIAAIGGDRDGEEEVVLLVQCGVRHAPEAEAMRARIAGAVALSFGVAAHVVLLPPRTLPFTTSGKLARARAKALYLSGQWADLIIADVEHVT